MIDPERPVGAPHDRSRTQPEEERARPRHDPFLPHTRDGTVDVLEARTQSEVHGPPRRERHHARVGEQLAPVGVEQDEIVRGLPRRQQQWVDARVTSGDVDAGAGQSVRETDTPVVEIERRLVGHAAVQFGQHRLERVPPGRRHVRQRHRSPGVPCEDAGAFGQRVPIVGARFDDVLTPAARGGPMSRARRFEIRAVPVRVTVEGEREGP